MAKSKNKIIEEADFEIKYYTASEEARYLADMRDLWESDRVSELNSAKRKAIEEGRKEGRKENQIEIAKKLLEMKESIDKIIKITGLSTCAYLVGYGLVRFVLETFRAVEQTLYLGGYPVSKLVSIVCILIGVAGICTLLIVNNKRKNTSKDSE
jgi:uncharacterized membrane protein YuzA (DUF378 family)